MKKPLFIISIDFELAWSFVNSGYVPPYIDNYCKKHNRVIQEFLSLLNKYEIPVTWAIVGKSLLDKYKNNPLLYAKNTLYQILNAAMEHEIASHSHSHIPFDRLSKNEARKDLELSKRVIVQVTGITPVTFIFPQSRIAHLKLLRELGFKVYRTRPNTILYKSQVLRILNKILLRKPYLAKVVVNNDLIAIEYSLLLQEDFLLREPILSLWAENTLQQAIKRKAIFHMVLHDYGLCSKGVMGILNELLRKVSEFRHQNLIKVLRLRDLVSLFGVP
ncbi:hypothetical protein DRN86_05425 [Candidatus Geothermarchaeota archaeon]|nr:MAG: hypothetical protein DRN86_05425 [Candidatus Geothermarchaeota archaeon]